MDSDATSHALHTSLVSYLEHENTSLCSLEAESNTTVLSDTKRVTGPCKEPALYVLLCQGILPHVPCNGLEQAYDRVHTKCQMKSRSTFYGIYAKAAIIRQNLPIPCGISSCTPQISTTNEKCLFSASSVFLVVFIAGGSALLSVQ